MAAAAAAVAMNGVAMATTSRAYLESKPVMETKALVSDLCRHFYTLGWVSGTWGSIAIKVHDDSIPKPQQLIVMSPSGVQKERMFAEDMYVLSSNGSVLSIPFAKPYPRKPPKCMDCAPLFMKAYEMLNAGAVIQSHGMESCLITHMEMIKGIQGHGYHDELVVPIIENTAYEGELTESLTEAIEAYPKATAVLVCNHGIYIWGDSWISAKTQLDLDWSTPRHGPLHYVNNGGHTSRVVKVGALNSNHAIEPPRHCILLDIEGTTTPISFVTDVLFPYARDNVRKHLTATYDTQETQDDIGLLRAQVQNDLFQGVVGAVPIPSNDAQKEDIIGALVANVEAMIGADRKITALKELQGHIWRTGFLTNEIKGEVFEDVPEAFEKWHMAGIKVYIYSSGSREAQRLIFGNSNYGDLRKYLCGFFDTKVGNKKEARSYFEISQSLGVDKPTEILFVTDVLQEAVAAKAAGLEVIVSIRPGNAPLLENHGFRTVESLLEI